MHSNYNTIAMGERKNIAIIAHDMKKGDILEWVKYNRAVLKNHNLLATGTTGTMIERELDVPITKFESGPLGGDQQIGAEIVAGNIDLVIFFWDPLESQPHDPDVKALLRLTVVWNIPVACNRATADFLISSSLMNHPYTRLVMNFDIYKNRFEPKTEIRATHTSQP